MSIAQSQQHLGLSVLHYTEREGLSSVYLSQTVGLMAGVAERGHPVSLLVATPVGEFFRQEPRRMWTERFAAIGASKGLTLNRIPSPPARRRMLWDEIPLLRARLSLKRTPDVAHCRGASATLRMLDARPGTKPHVIFDCRGLDAPEHLLVNGYRSLDDAPPALLRQALALEAKQAKAAQRAQAVICVSRAMAEYVGHHWGVDEKKLVVVPCAVRPYRDDLVDAWRDESRKALGLANKRVIAYCGSVEAWQIPATVMRIVAGVMQRCADVALLAITTKPDALARYGRVAGVPENRAVYLRLPQHKVAATLAAADLGLLVREGSLVNAVASPVKFAEYLAAGLPVAVSDGVGDYSDLTVRQGLGCRLKAANDTETAVDMICRWLDQDVEAREKARLACLRVARQELSVRQAVDRLIDLYASLKTAG